MLYSLVFELIPLRQAVLPLTMGHLAHACFLNLIKRFDSALSARLHDEPTYRPYTISPLIGGKIADECITLRRNQPCYLRITLFDGGHIWRILQGLFLEAGPISVRLGDTDFQLTRILSTPHTGPVGWVDSMGWQKLMALQVQHTITLSFCTPTAFSLGNHQFHLFPEPPLVWESLLRVWNTYVPESRRIEKVPLCTCIEKSISVISCTLNTAFLKFPRHTQKGFIGQCTYQLATDHPLAPHLTTLAAFAFYSGIGYKTTMGMGQVRVEFGNPLAIDPSHQHQEK